MLGFNVAKNQSTPSTVFHNHAVMNRMRRVKIFNLALTVIYKIINSSGLVFLFTQMSAVYMISDLTIVVFHERLGTGIL